MVPQQPPPPQQPQWIFEASSGPMWPPVPPPPPAAAGSAAVGSSHPSNFSSSQLAMNGSQPCLMIPEVAERDLVYDDHYYPAQFVLDAPCGSSLGGHAAAPIIERQRSLPRTSRPQSNNQPIPPPPPHLQPSLSRKGNLAPNQINMLIKTYLRFFVTLGLSLFNSWDDPLIKTKTISLTNIWGWVYLET